MERLGKGAKLGVQSSSDHVSTHISYADFWVDGDRRAILAAMKARRSFAATDKFSLDIRMGEALHGRNSQPPMPAAAEVYVSGTGPIAQVQVVKSGRIVYTAPGTGSEMRFKYEDQGAADRRIVLLRARGAEGRPALLELADLGG